MLREDFYPSKALLEHEDIIFARNIGRWWRKHFFRCWELRMKIKWKMILSGIGTILTLIAGFLLGKRKTPQISEQDDLEIIPLPTKLPVVEKETVLEMDDEELEESFLDAVDAYYDKLDQLESNGRRDNKNIS